MTGTAGEQPERKESWNLERPESGNGRKVGITRKLQERPESPNDMNDPCAVFSYCSARFTIWRNVLLTACQ